MQFVFARRGRRVFQRLTLHQTAPLSTRASPATGHLRRVSRLSSTRTPSVTKAVNSPIAILASTNAWAKSYATAATGRGRPKAHTGKATAKKSATNKTQKKKTTKKTAKPAAKKELTPEQLEKKKASKQAAKLKEEIKTLLVASLKENEPKLAGVAPWNLFVQQKLRGNTSRDLAATFREISADFQNLSSSEREALQDQAAQNKQANERAYTAWVNSHTPLQIKEANYARKRLLALTEDRRYPVKLHQIKDERQVKRPLNTFILFSTERGESGDLKHMSIQEKGRHVKAEFENMSEEEKQKFVTRAQQDRERYIREYREVYGQDPVTLRKPEKASP
ncbi:hypothetical protein BGW36DRAFT_36740 [Talaromyces proteolyticus]|uniref:HMG box domain-containing protein n=1 Tax=Talaromyces proteolyticus TaxID=1131652 RepID=A0AAD4KM25_9EURO|nr:uncharacterized protein BGW36DRAFT_36740 [Talaromyces proteolyticus]KAH8693237.1 hypothetical protein BGW36DRAFT_36740 [Talaromyces proteolyticus]